MIIILIVIMIAKVSLRQEASGFRTGSGQKNCVVYRRAANPILLVIVCFECAHVAASTIRFATCCHMHSAMFCRAFQ